MLEWLAVLEGVIGGVWGDDLYGLLRLGVQTLFVYGGEESLGLLRLAPYLRSP